MYEFQHLSQRKRKNINNIQMLNKYMYIDIYKFI